MPDRPIAEGVDYGMDEHVDDLVAILGALDLAPAHLVGHSYGGLVCLLLAIRHPETRRGHARDAGPIRLRPARPAGRTRVRDRMPIRDAGSEHYLA